MFGGFGAYVGIIWDGEIEGRIPADQATRNTPDIFYEKHGDTHSIEFYTYDYELFLMYDCRIVIRGSNVTSEYMQIEEADFP
jgi:hypothetical protein